MSINISNSSRRLYPKSNFSSDFIGQHTPNDQHQINTDNNMPQIYQEYDIPTEDNLTERNQDLVSSRGNQREKNITFSENDIKGEIMLSTARKTLQATRERFTDTQTDNISLNDTSHPFEKHSNFVNFYSAHEPQTHFSKEENIYQMVIRPKKSSQHLFRNSSYVNVDPEAIRFDLKQSVHSANKKIKLDNTVFYSQTKKISKKKTVKNKEIYAGNPKEMISYKKNMICKVINSNTYNQDIIDQCEYIEKDNLSFLDITQIQSELQQSKSLGMIESFVLSDKKVKETQQNELIQYTIHQYLNMKKTKTPKEIYSSIIRKLSMDRKQLSYFPNRNYLKKKYTMYEGSQGVE